MYEQLTGRARKVLQRANKEAQRLNHEYIGTEALLLALVKEGSGVGANILKNLDIDLQRIALEIEQIVQEGDPDMISAGVVQQTPRVKKVIEYAVKEARNFDHKHVGTEHLLIGLLRDRDGVASVVLTNLGLKLEDAREEMLNILSQRGEATSTFPPRMEASGEFDVKLVPVDTGDVKMGMMSLDKQYHGHLEATGKGRMLTGMTDVKTSAAYVAIEQVEGKLREAEGSFLLQHAGVMTKEVQSLVIRVVPDSGTGALAGIKGEMHIKVEGGKHFYRFEYTLGQ